jgi:hypothetical protein
VFKSLCIFSFILLTACQQGYKFDLPATNVNFDGNVQYNNKVDLIFIVDNSSSMEIHQQTLIRSIPTMINSLLSLKMDFHIAVISTSMGGATPNGGRFLGSPMVLTNTTPDLINLLTERIVLGQAGSNVERGLESLQAVLQSNYLNGLGAGFWRPDALLSIISLSDEDDAGGFDPQAYAAWLDVAKAPFAESGKRSWMMNFIGVLSLTGTCRSFNQSAIVGSAYISLSQLSGGVTESICANDLSTAVSNIRARIVQVLVDFPLRSRPNIETIQVYVNNSLVPRSSTNGWDYLSQSNSVRFYGVAIPAADASIRIDFKPAEAN